MSGADIAGWALLAAAALLLAGGHHMTALLLSLSSLLPWLLSRPSADQRDARRRNPRPMAHRETR